MITTYNKISYFGFNFDSIPVALYISDTKALEAKNCTMPIHRIISGYEIWMVENRNIYFRKFMLNGETFSPPVDRLSSTVSFNRFRKFTTFSSSSLDTSCSRPGPFFDSSSDFSRKRYFKPLIILNNKGVPKYKNISNTLDKITGIQ